MGRKHGRLVVSGSPRCFSGLHRMSGETSRVWPHQLLLGAEVICWDIHKAATSLCAQTFLAVLITQMERNAHDTDFCLAIMRHSETNGEDIPQEQSLGLSLTTAEAQCKPLAWLNKLSILSLLCEARRPQMRAINVRFQQKRTIVFGSTMRCMCTPCVYAAR